MITLLTLLSVSLICEGSGNRRALYNGEEYRDTVRVELQDNGGRIQLPRAMLPPEMKGGSSGWYDLRDFVATREKYQARVRVNIINYPHIELNRIAGTIKIDGGQSMFSGKCEPISQDAAPKF